jgi:glucose-6-phosphate isomerase
MDRISVYWGHATAAAVGAGRGLTDQDLADLAPRAAALVRETADARKAGRPDVRFRDEPYDEDAADAVRREVEHFRDRGCEVLVVLAAGTGTAAGHVALQQALNPPTYNLLSDRVRSSPQLFVLDTADPDHVKAVADVVAGRARRTVVHVIDAGGASAAAAAQFLFFRDLLQSRVGRKYREHIVATTDPAGGGGTLRDVATSAGYRMLDATPGPDGRFGALSPAGLFPVALCGVDVDGVLAGAQDMDRRLREPDPLRNPAALVAAAHYLLDARGVPAAGATAAAFCASLNALAAWAGKRRAKDVEDVGGPAPAGAGPGVASVAAGLVTFLEVERFGSKVTIPSPPVPAEPFDALAGGNFQALIQNQKLAAEHALLEAGRPSLTVVFPQVSPETVGQYVYLNQSIAAWLGELLGGAGAGADGPAGGEQAVYALMGRAGGAAAAQKIRAATKRERAYLI